MTAKKNNPLILVIFFLIFVCSVLGTIAFVMQVMKPKSENFQMYEDNMQFNIWNWRPGEQIDNVASIEITSGTYHHGNFDIHSVNIGQMGSSNEIFIAWDVDNHTMVGEVKDDGTDGWRLVDMTAGDGGMGDMGYGGMGGMGYGGMGDGGMGDMGDGDGGMGDMGSRN